MTLTNKDVREALQGSIVKWGLIVAGKGIDKSLHNCSLCHIFSGYSSWADCDGCPIAIDTNQTGCLGSPWEDWSDYCGGRLNQPWGQYKVTDKKSKKLAQAELDYLINLDKKFFGN